MKIIKLIMPVILIFALSLPTYAMHLPENKVIDRELTVEDDENVVDKSINGTAVNRPAKTFILSKRTYLIRIVFPFLLIFSLGPLYLLIEYGIRNYKRKSHSQ